MSPLSLTADLMLAGLKAAGEQTRLRILARHRKIETPFPNAKPEAKAMLVQLLDPDQPGEFAQAMMDLGATLCSPRSPSCLICPIQSDCKARQAGEPERYPVKLPKKQKPTRSGAAFVIENDKGEIFLCKRSDTGLLASMTQVPTTDWTARQDGSTDVSEAPVDADWHKAGTIRHTFTHFHLELTVWHTHSDEAPTLAGWWSAKNTLPDLAIPKMMQKVLACGLG